MVREVSSSHAVCRTVDADSYTAEFYYDDSDDHQFWPFNLVNRLRSIQYRVIFSYALQNQCDQAVRFKADLHYFDERGAPIWNDQTPIFETRLAPGAAYRHTHQGKVSAHVRNHAQGLHPIIYEARFLEPGY